jgi:hypothetical protein
LGGTDAGAIEDCFTRLRRGRNQKRHASGVNDIVDTLALQSIQWRHNVAPGGGITVNWVAELTVSSN